MAPPARREMLIGNNGCPRCNGFVVLEEELICINCGHRDRKPPQLGGTAIRTSYPKPRRYAW